MTECWSRPRCKTVISPNPNGRRDTMKIRYLLALLVWLPLAGLAAEVGKPAPAFTLTDIQGQRHALEDYRGRTVVLEWTNAECPFVKKHYDSGNMQKQQSSAVADGVVWLTINSGAPGKQG